MTLLRMLTAVLAAIALAAPAALARPADIHAPLVRATAEANKQDLRSPDTRDAARATTPPDPSAGRPETAGNPNVSAGAVRAALAQERYYASYGKPAPLTKETRTVAADTRDGIARLPFVIAVFGALIVGLGAGSGLHLLHGRRRHASRLAT